ncbi:unnamed protein product, partial [Meganyctiphanes norvegica]
FYAGPYGKIWSDDLCPTIDPTNGTFDGTVESCKSLCCANDPCTAIHYCPVTPDCVLKDCGSPVPRPDLNYGPYKGYKKIDDPTRPPCSNNGGICMASEEECTDGQWKEGQKYCRHSKFYPGCCI